MRIVLVALIGVLLLNGALGVWGMISVRQTSSSVLQDILPKMRHITQAQDTLNTVTTDDEEAMLTRVLTGVAAPDTTIIAGDAQLWENSITTLFLERFDSQQARIDLAQIHDGFTNWQIAQQQFTGLINIPASAYANYPALLYEQFGVLQSSATQMQDLLIHLASEQQSRLSAQSVASATTSSHIIWIFGLATLGGLLMIAILGARIMHAFGQIYQRQRATNNRLRETLAEVQCQSEEITAQQDALREANTSLAVAVSAALQGREMQEAILRSITSDVVLVFDLQGTLVQCNDAVSTLFGYDRTELIGQVGVPFYRDEADRQSIRDLIAGFAQNQEILQLEHTWFTRADREVRMELRVSMAPELGMMMIIGRDISAHLKMEQDLQAALEESDRARHGLDIVFAMVRDGLIVVDATGVCVFRNQAYSDIIGSEADPHAVISINSEEHSRNFTLLTMDGTFVPVPQRPIQRIIRGEMPDPPTNYRIITSQHEHKIVQIEAVSLGMQSNGALWVMGVIRDITSEFRESEHNEILRTLARECAGAVDMRSVAVAAMRTICEGLHATTGAIAIRDPERPGYARVLDMRVDRAVTSQDAATILRLAEESPIAPDAPMLNLRTMATGKASFNVTPLPIAANQEDTPHLPAIRTVSYLPLIAGGQTIGVLNLGLAVDDVKIWDGFDKALLVAAADEIATSLHRAQLYEETRRLALYDPLTGLRNHRALQQALQQALDSATEDATMVSVIMLDVDHFRRFNETYGHDVGDRALQTVAQAIQSAIRTQDLAARYGGEEFTIVLPDTSSAVAASIAERIRLAIASHQVMARGEDAGIPVTASLGYATFPQQASIPISLLKAADIALYAAKHAGRNCVIAYSTDLLEATPFQTSAPDQPVTADQSAGLPHPRTQLPAHASLDMIEALIMAIDLRDGFTAAHSHNVSRYAADIARCLGLPPHEVEFARLGGLIHDIGKIDIPGPIVRKTGPMTMDETRIMRTHPVIGEALVRPVTAYTDLLPMIRSHHERLDGSGYPDGLCGDQIPLLVRIVTVADVFDACIASRPYHPSRPIEVGLRTLNELVAKGELDGEVVAAFARSIANESGMPVVPSPASELPMDNPWMESPLPAA